MEADDISTKTTKAVTDLAEIERVIIDLRARLAASEAKCATQEAQLVEMREKLIALTFEKIHDLKENATEHLSAMGEEMSKFTRAIGDAFEVEMISNEIVVPLARRFPNLRVTQTRKGEGVVSWTLGPEGYEVCVFVSLVKDDKGRVVHPLRYKVAHDLGAEFKRANGIPFTEICDTLENMLLEVQILQGYIESNALEFIRTHDDIQ